MNSNPQVRVIREFVDNGRHFAKGFVFVPNGVHRDWLLNRGLIEVVKAEDVQAAATDAVQPPVKLPRASKVKAKAIA